MQVREPLLPATAVTRINVARLGLENSFYTAWVMSRHSARLPGTSAPGGEADVIAAKADIAPRMSAIRGKADVWRDRRFGLLLAISGHTATRVRSPKSSEIGCTGNPHDPAVLGLDLHGTEANATPVRNSVHFRKRRSTKYIGLQLGSQPTSSAFLRSMMPVPMAAIPAMLPLSRNTRRCRSGRKRRTMLSPTRLLPRSPGRSLNSER